MTLFGLEDGFPICVLFLLYLVLCPSTFASFRFFSFLFYLHVSLLFLIMKFLYSVTVGFFFLFSLVTSLTTIYFFTSLALAFLSFIYFLESIPLSFYQFHSILLMISSFMMHNAPMLTLCKIRGGYLE